MLIHLGSSEFNGTSGILVIDGEEQVQLEIGKNDGALLVSMDLYDDKGTHIAKLRRNAWVFHHGNVFEAKSGMDVNSGARTFGIRELASKEIVLNGAAFSQDDFVSIPQARFWTKKGRLLVVEPGGDIVLAGLRFGRMLLVGTDNAIVMDDNGVSLG